MKLLVCGGRDFDDYLSLCYVLDRLRPAIKTVIQGGQVSKRELPDGNVQLYGADYYAKRWAGVEGIECIEERAEWEKHGNAAGPIRNGLMLEKHKPDLVLAFPGGRGTANMIKQARLARVPVLEVKL